MSFRVVIVGGGILGVFIAREIARSSGEGVLVIRRRDRPRPVAESLLNQAWRQSGIHYFKGGVDVALAIRDAATILLQQFSLESPERGVARVPEADLEAFERVAVRIGGITVLQPSVASARLGGFFRKGPGQYYEIPDSPFPEAELIQMARDEAGGQGVKFIETDSGVALDADKDGRVSVVMDSVRLEAHHIIVAAGCATDELLRPLGVNAGLEIVRTPLLIVKHAAGLPVSLLSDRIQGFSVTQPVTNRLVFGARGKFRLIDGTDPRKATDEETRHLAELASEASGVRLNPSEYRSYAGLEIQAKASADVAESADAKFRREVLPLSGADERFPNLRWCLPGRATLALSAARNIVGSLSMGRHDGSSSIEVGTPWDDDVSMYFHHSYD